MNMPRNRFLMAIGIVAVLGLAADTTGAQEFKFKAAKAEAEETAAAAEGAGKKQVQIGNAAKVTRLVKAYLGDDVRDVQMMAEIYQNELIETGASSAAEIKFMDETRLNLGPDSKIVLDEFVFDPRPGKGKMVLSATKGVFRFVSGKMASKNYTVKTPVATMGVRGTSFTFIVGDDGGTIVAVADGEISVSNSEGVEVSVKAGLSTTVKPPDETGAVPPPAEPGPPPPELDEIVGEMDLALEEAEEGEGEEGEEDVAGDEGEEGEDAEAAAEEALENAEDIAAGEIIPEDVLAGLLDGTTEGLAALEAYLNGEGLDAETAAGRALALLEALQALGASGPDRMLAMVSNILELVSSTLESSELGIEVRLMLEEMVTVSVGEVISDIDSAAGEEIDPAFESDISASPT